MSRNRATALLADPYSVIKRPVLTEKTHRTLPHYTEAGDSSARYTFEVHPKATKHQIKLAIEQAFEVQVDSVCTMIVKPKKRAFRMRRGKGSQGMTRLKKKAVVRLAAGSKGIELI
jgi:large subunit ribosomal protein L23